MVNQELDLDVAGVLNIITNHPGITFKNIYRRYVLGKEELAMALSILKRRNAYYKEGDYYFSSAVTPAEAKNKLDAIHAKELSALTDNPPATKTEIKKVKTAINKIRKAAKAVVVKEAVTTQPIDKRYLRRSSAEGVIGMLFYEMRNNSTHMSVNDVSIRLANLLEQHPKYVIYSLVKKGIIKLTHNANGHGHYIWTGIIKYPFQSRLESDDIITDVYKSSRVYDTIRPKEVICRHLNRTGDKAIIAMWFWYTRDKPYAYSTNCIHSRFPDIELRLLRNAIYKLCKDGIIKKVHTGILEDKKINKYVWGDVLKQPFKIMETDDVYAIMTHGVIPTIKSSYKLS